MCECGHQIEIMVESLARRNEHLVDVRSVMGVVEPVFDPDADAFEKGQRLGRRGADRRLLLDQRIVGAIDLVAVEDDKAAREKTSALFLLLIGCL